MPADVIEARFVAEEHQRIRAGLGGIEDAIADAHRMSRAEAIDRVVQTLQWVRRDVLPHSAWEEAWLYPRLDADAGTAWATRALRFEHEQIRELAGALETEFELARGRWSSEIAFRLVAALARLDAIIRAHLAQEERFAPTV
jgi:hemerythrin-like domain-containing protein